MNHSYRLLCFGDSNTFGWIGSLNGTTRRYPRNIRWTGRLAHQLGPQWEVIEEGLGGRTIRDQFTVGTDITLAGAGLNGKEYLPACLLSHLPLDVVLIMLGSNDMKSALGRSAESIAEGMEELVDLILSKPWASLLDYPAPRILIVSPPYIGSRKMELAGARYIGAPEKSRQLGALYADIAARKGIDFFDAAEALISEPAGEAHGIDGMHLDETDHLLLATTLFDKLQKMNIEV